MGAISRRTLIETQDIKESQVTGTKVLDHTLGSQELGTSAAIIVEGTQIKEDLITEHHVLDHTLGSHNLGTTVAIIVEGTQIKDAIVTMDKLESLSEFGTLAGVTKTGTYLHFDTAFGAAPTLVVASIAGGPGTVAELGAAPAAGSANVNLTGSGTIVVEYVAWGAR